MVPGLAHVFFPKPLLAFGRHASGLDHHVAEKLVIAAVAARDADPGALPVLSVSWPTGEMGPMGLEGAVQLAYRKELSAIADPEQRQKKYQDYVADMYRQGKAMNAASYMEIDDVIDPAETRRWLSHGLLTAPKRMEGSTKKRAFIDAW